MHPAFSVIFLTTLIGVGQGLFLALYTGEIYGILDLLPTQDAGFYGKGALIALVFMIGGLGASVFHLGKPSYFVTRAWRAAFQWRTSWLSREILFLPTTMALIFFYAVAHLADWQPQLFSETLSGQGTLVLGAVTTASVFMLFICTAMIYASIRFLQEWACSLTVVNYILLGSASGFVLATAYASISAPELAVFYGKWAIILTMVALISRTASLIRNANLKAKSTIQTAIGVRHSDVVQKSMGMMGGSYNTREYFHGKTAAFFKSVKWVFLVLVFALPLLLLWSAIGSGSSALLILAFVAQYVGLLFERWFFFAQANHPQNIYYQTV